MSEPGSVPRPTAPVGLQKAPTGIKGFDEITNGGLPRGRPTLVTGAAGSGKTMFGIEFLVRGARDYGEPGVLLAFEEAQADLVTNVASLGFDIEQLESDGLLAIDAFRIDPSEIIETGASDSVGAVASLVAQPASARALTAAMAPMVPSFVNFTRFPSGVGVMRGHGPVRSASDGTQRR